MGIIDSFHKPVNARKHHARKQFGAINKIKTKLRRPGRACLNSCNLLSGPAHVDADRLKRALFELVLNCCGTEPVTRSVASVPCQRRGCTFLDYNDGTGSGAWGFQVRYLFCTFGNFVVNFGNFLLGLPRAPRSIPMTSCRIAMFAHRVADNLTS